MAGADEAHIEVMADPDKGPLRRILRFAAEGLLPVCFMATLALALLMRGAVDPLQGAEIGGLMGTLCMIALLVCGEPRSTATAFRIAIAIGVVLAAWVFVQTLRLPELANPAWSALGGLAGPGRDTISVAPADSRASIVVLVLPFLTFLSALCLFPTDRKAERLLSFIGYFGGGLAMFAIGQFLLDDNALMFGEKRFYIGSLTAPFVNRNTAGTFYGLISLVLTAQVFLALRKVDFRRLILGTPPNPERGPLSLRHLILTACLIASLVALFLTRSRGAVGSAFAAFILFVPLLAILAFDPGASRYGFRVVRRGMLKRVLVPISTFAGVLLAGLIFADRALFRAEVQGLDDGRFCVAPAIFKAARDHQWLGTGFGTFRLFFSALRDPECGISGIWDRAHSVYLEAYLGLGIVFVVILIIGTCALVIFFLQGIKTRRRLRAYPLSGLAILVLVAAHSAIDFSLQIPGFAVVFAAVTAGLVTISKGRTLHHDRPRRSARPQPTPASRVDTPSMK